SAYTDLAHRIRASGLLDRSPRRYVVRALVLAAGFAIGLWSLFALGTSWWQLLIAVGFGLLFTQMAFLAHDGAHRQIFTSGTWNEWASRILGNLVVGLSYGWWQRKHSRHHANPNKVDADEDIRPGVLLFTPEDARRRTGLRRWLTARQGWLFFPLLLLEGLNLHVSAVRTVAGDPKLTHRRAPNRQGMPLVPRDTRVDFLSGQVLTSRNIRGRRWVDVLMGGLNLQIEHHLFPSMPSHNLRRAQPIVRQYCAEQGVPYTEAGL